MPLTGYSATTLAGLVLDGGQIRILNTVLGVTRGGVRFDPGDDWNEVEFDGRSAPVEGMDRLGFSRATLSFTLLEASAANLALLMPGSSSVTAGGVTTITPRAARAFVAAQANARAVFDQGNGKFLEIRFAKFLAKLGGVETADRSEAGLSVVIEARAVGTDATTIVAPTWVMKIHDAIGTVTI